MPILNKVTEKLGRIGLVGERRAVTLLLLSMFMFFFLLLTLVARDQMPEWVPAFSAMLALYVTCFMGVAAGWFWGRWVAIGVGYWGVTIAAWGFVQARSLEPALVVLGVTHGLIALLLSGDSMAAEYEARGTWRTRLGLDDAAVMKLRRSVTRTASSVPAIVLFALAPRQEDGSMLVACVVIGIGALLMGRSLSLLAIAGAAIGSFVLGATATGSVASTHGYLYFPHAAPQALALYAGVALSAALSPFVAPVSRYLRGK